MNSDLYDHPTLYDVLFPVGTHLPYYAELARQASGDILELACGTRQLILPLASAGLRIAGLDLSEPMLRIAIARSSGKVFRLDFLFGLEVRRQRFNLFEFGRVSLSHAVFVPDTRFPSSVGTWN